MFTKLPQDEFEKQVIDLMTNASKTYIPLDRGYKSVEVPREITISSFTNWTYIKALLGQYKFEQFYTVCMEFVVVKYIRSNVI